MKILRNINLLNPETKLDRSIRLLNKSLAKCKAVLDEINAEEALKSS